MPDLADYVQLLCIMNNSQSIENPFGITVFGSAILRVEPDFIVLNFSASALKTKPKDAFQEARDRAIKIARFLEQAKIPEVATSQAQLSPTSRYTNGESRFVGYTAKIIFNVILRDVSSLEAILSGVVEAGSSEVTSVEFQTSHLKEFRAQARKNAVAAAREKAEVYCEAAGVKLGKVIYIEDRNPEMLRGRESHTVSYELPIDDVSGGAFNPGSLPVGAAVVVAFNFLD